MRFQIHSCTFRPADSGIEAAEASDPMIHRTKTFQNTQFGRFLIVDEKMPVTPENGWIAGDGRAQCEQWLNSKSKDLIQDRLIAHFMIKLVGSWCNQLNVLLRFGSVLVANSGCALVTVLYDKAHHSKG